MKIRFLLLTALVLWQPLRSISQNQTADELFLQLVENNAQYIQDFHLNGFIWFNPNSLPQGVIQKTPQLIGLPVQHTLELKKAWTDSDGYRQHQRYQQKIQGLTIEYAEVFEHVENGFVTSINGKIADAEVLSETGLTPRLASEQALTYALAELEGSEFAWEDTAWENYLKTELENPEATYYPQAELLLAYLGADAPSYFLSGTDYRLAYKFDIQLVNDGVNEVRSVYVDAHTGEVLKNNSNLRYNSNADTQFYGNRQLDSDWRGGLFSHHFLRANDGKHNLHTKSWDAKHPWSKLDDITFHKKHGNWGSWNYRSTTAHWGVTTAYDYFHTVHNRVSADGNTGAIRIRTGWPTANAKYDYNPSDGSNNITVGRTIYDGEYWYLNSLDVMGHEFAHGVSKHTANFAYSNESGALEEAISDMFGVLVEKWMFNGTSVSGIDWTIAEDTEPAFGIEKTRSLSDPPSRGEHISGVGCVLALGQPDHVTHPYYSNLGTSCNNAAVHINSGVPNKWFHLLTDGGTHYGQSVVGIGTSTAETLLYDALVNELGSLSGFLDARSATLSVARRLYGLCSQAEISVANAWAAVGVGSPSGCGGVSVADLQVEKAYIHLFPNPTTQHITLHKTRGKGLHTYTYQLMDAYGKRHQIQAKTVSDDKVVFSVGGLANGLYLLNVLELGRIVSTKKFVKGED